MTDPARPPLSHLRVLDLSRMYPGAFCSLVLADLGADVVKIEAPGFGDGLRGLAPPGTVGAAHAALNRGKRSVALDLRHAGAPEVLGRLVRHADVVIEAHRPGQLDRQGLGHDAMKLHNPALVWCSITGFGDTGLHSQEPGHDITYLGESGLLDRLNPDDAPIPAATLSIPLAALMAAVGILAAVADAARTGEGRRLDANMTESAMWALTEDVTRESGAPGLDWGTMSARNVYRCSDGRQVSVASTEPKSWAELCRALDLPDLAGRRLGDPDDDAVTARLVERFAERPSTAWLQDPGLAGGVGAVARPADLLSDAHLASRESIVELPGTAFSVLANPIRFGSAGGGQASAALRPPPGLGEHTDPVLAAAAFSPDDVARLRADKVIA